MSRYLDMNTRPCEPVHVARSGRFNGSLAHRVGGIFARTFRLIFGARAA